MKHSRSSLFLMELMIAILFFALAGTICIQLFVKSHLISKESVNQNHAVTHAQNLAEGYLGLDGDITALSGLFPLSQVDNDNMRITLSFDKNWRAVSGDGAVYTAVLRDNGYSPDTGLASADITVTDTSAGYEIYSLHIEHHIPERSASKHE